MNANQMTLREARKRISQILASGDTVIVARPHEEVRGFLVGVKPHSRFVGTEKQKALAAAKKAFLKAWGSAHE